MAQPFAEAFYRGKAWKKCRQSYIKQRVMIDGGLCEECKERQGYIVHHKIILTAENINDPEISLNHNHLEYQCKPCHDLEEGHGLNKKSLPLLRFDDNGDPIPP